MNWIIVQDVVFLLLLVGLSIPLGLYIYRVMMGKPVFLSRLIALVEKRIYRLMGVRDEEEMGAKKYVASVLLFSLFGFLVVFALHLLQGVLPLNPEGMKAVSWDMSFNTAASFVSNTNWQAYSGEQTLSYLTQVLGLTVQNFLSAAVGIAVLFTLIRGFVVKQKTSLGNFWKDLTRVTLYVLIPLSLIVSILLVTQGVVQSTDTYKTVATVEDGQSQVIPTGPAASQIAIKQLGTNGGGFFGANSAYPLENPTNFSNLIELLSIILIPAALCVSFGKAVRDNRQGRTIYLVMSVLLVLAIVGSVASEWYLSAHWADVLAAGNMEGKEVVHGVGTSSLWSVVTTAASNGSVNAMHDSLTPLGGLVPLFLMQLGEIVFGGVGSGLYGMLAFVILTVFIAGLMVGRTPEYLGKKIEPYDMRMVCTIILVPPLVSLVGTAAAVMMPQVGDWLTNKGAHGFTEVLYAFTSMGNNNGSAFAGFMANTTFTNVVGGLMMLIVRFVPLAATIFLAGNMAKKKSVAVSEGTLSTTSSLFVGLLIGIILMIGALSFLPVLALGPIADFIH